MIPKPEDEKIIRKFLLGELEQEERHRFEENLLSDDRLVTEVSLVEDELIDDYELGVLSAGDREKFERRFLTTPERKRKLALTRRLKRYASSAKNRGKRWSRVSLPSVFGSTPAWAKAAACAIVLLGLCLICWRIFFYGSPVSQALAALNRAYREARPVEARISGFNYAPFKSSTQRGVSAEKDGEQKVDYVELERAKTWLFGSNVKLTDPAAMHALGKYYLAQKEFDKAIDQFRKALALNYDNTGLHSDLGAALLGKIEGDRLKESGRLREDFDQCLIHLNKALESDPSFLDALFNRALLYQREHLRREAREDWKKYLELDPKSQWSEEARANLAAIEKELNKVSQKNSQLYQDFLNAQQENNDNLALEKFGLSYSLFGNYIVKELLDGFLKARFEGPQGEAEEKLNALSRIGKLSMERTGDRFTADLAKYYRQAQVKQLTVIRRARELMAEGHKLYENSRNDKAIEKFEQARVIFDQEGATGESLFAEAWIGHCHHQRSDTDQNLKIFKRLVPVSKERNYLWIQANAYCGRANAHASSGQVSLALEDCSRCGEISDKVGDIYGLIRSMYIRGSFYQDLGKHDEALLISRKGLELSDRYSIENRYSISFYQISSSSLTSFGLFEAARASQMEAVKMAEETKSPRLKARAHFYLGLIYARLKKYDDAISSIQRGIAIGRELGSDETGQEFVHFGLIHLADVFREAARFSEALDTSNQIIEYFGKSGRQLYLYAGSKGRLLTLIAQNNVAAAQVELDRVISLYENYRKSIKEESNRNKFFDQEQGIYDVAIDFAYTKLNDPQRALFYSELCRARSLLDVSKEGSKTVAGHEVPDLKINAGTTPVSPDQIRSRMPDGVQLLEFAVVNDKLLVWLITKARVEIRSVSIQQNELTARVNQYMELVARPPDLPELNDRHWLDQAAGLYDTLIRPVEASLDKEKQVCIIPDKVLNRLPFGSLFSRESGKLLAEQYALFYAPSANLFLDSSEKAQRKSGSRSERLLATGNPRFFAGDFPMFERLPSAEQEVTGVAAFYDSPVLLVGERVKKSAVIREMERADVVHFALHYETNSRSPMLSRIPMASNVAKDPEGALQMHELYRLRASQPRLVVLSACQTTAEEYLGGEGAIGVSRPFEAVGVPLVVASLWPVDTVATSNLMIAFHAARKQSGLPTVEALRRAQLMMFNSAGKYRHPYYWAAFIPIGGYTEY